ncbi:prefoldin subunit 4 [Aquila chrysaetos chrysaetos]|uniref:Prefoldin subunit 4 n=1 Tax=Aquila chrysaetos chrysaetos TaxID=223781 RepID=A0A663EM88_AQUCH|nr:prefoldin subunit 4 [Aquila chrysaetos chrysaetos]
MASGLLCALWTARRPWGRWGEGEAAGRAGWPPPGASPRLPLFSRAPSSSSVGRVNSSVPPTWAATMKKAAAEDVNVTFEDQQKINKFARNTSRITELKEEIEVKKKQLQNLEDACDDIMMLDDGDSLLIPYQIGDVFISHSQEETQEMLEEAKKSLQEEIEALESRVESIQRVLSDLKVQLYAKFGNNINLEAEDS